MSTAVWLSSAVLNVSLFLTGIVVLRGIRFVITPPSVSTPRAQRRNIQQQDIVHFACQNASLNRRADRHDLIGVDALVRLLTIGQRANQVLHHRHARRAAHQDDLVQSRRLILASASACSNGFRQRSTRSSVKLLELRAREASSADASVPSHLR